MLIERPSYQKEACNEGVGDAFFDSFAAAQPRNKKERKAAFNSGLDASNCVNGAELLALAAQAANVVVFCLHVFHQLQQMNHPTHPQRRLRHPMVA